MVAIKSSELKFVSGPTTSRVGFFPLLVAIVLGFAFVCVWLAVAVVAAFQNLYWAVVIVAAASAFALYLGYAAFGMFNEWHRNYIVELNPSELVLNVEDRYKHTKSTQMVLLKDVKYVEYYPYRDSASAILHTAYNHIEIPLWPLSGHGEDVINYLEGRGIRIFNVQLDDEIPPS